MKEFEDIGFILEVEDKNFKCKFYGVRLISSYLAIGDADINKENSFLKKQILLYK